MDGRLLLLVLLQLLVVVVSPDLHVVAIHVHLVAGVEEKVLDQEGGVQAETDDTEQKFDWIPQDATPAIC